MHTSPADIIVPIWNRPIETRHCLASIIETAPDIRLIIVDTGSDRETESILQEVADALDEHAILLSNNQNCGFVAAVNQGLFRSDASFAVIVRQSSVMSPGWLEPMLQLAADLPEAGLIVPCFSTSTGGTGKDLVSVAREADHGSFAAMLVRRTLYETIGGFDPDLDGGEWCLKEYSRRALQAGFLTCRAAASRVAACDERQFGSAERRAELITRSRERTMARTGKEMNYCLSLTPSSTVEECETLFRILLQGGRQGHRIEVLVPHRLNRLMKQAGYGLLHDNIRLHSMPIVGGERAARRTFERLQGELPGIVPAVLQDGQSDFGAVDAVPFTDLQRLIMAGLPV